MTTNLLESSVLWAFETLHINVFDCKSRYLKDKSTEEHIHLYTPKKGE